MSARTVQTPHVRPGDRIAVICPASPVDQTLLTAGVAWLGQRYRIDEDPRRAARNGFFAGTDDERAAALLEAVRDPGIRAIVAGRGGYGSLRVLERVGPELGQALQRDPKPLVGFSDITALHSVWTRTGVRSLHAVMAAAMGRESPAALDRDALVAALEGGTVAAWEGLDVWCAGEATGTAVGGNLALVAALQGTPYAVPMRDAVLFLEDVGERPYRVDRMLTTLRLGGVLREVRAVVLGEFIDCAPGPDGRTVTEVLRDRVCDLGVPVLYGDRFGHGTNQRVIAFGRAARVTERGTVEFLGDA